MPGNHRRDTPRHPWLSDERAAGVTSVDVVQVHALDAIDLDFVLGAGGAVGELERMRDEGKLRAIGFGIRGAAYHRRAIASGLFDAILIHDDFSLIRRTDTSVIEETAAAGVGVLVGRALMTGLLAGPDPMANERLAVDPDAPGAREWWLWTRRRGVPLQAVALQFPMRHPGVGTVVVGASYPREIEENVAAATFPVPDEIWAEVEARMRRRA